ncbi:hypothetical protein AGMMS50256_26500 [Betaproteobacteria bacterium]|nr:hypothetical protein AGMMS50256_26500 [Betaproteobacteria bacterium]
MNTDREATIDLDRPLLVGEAINGDKLNRKGFAQSAVDALRQVTSKSGFVLSIEGAWGSGKTSTLAMIEELLGKASGDKSPQPLIVHFNPWLVGERDALLRLFLAKIALAVKLTDHVKNGQKVAKELKAYSRAFDVVKLIPGAEPWASIAKAVITSVGKATGTISDLKTPDIECQKTKVENALREFPRPIIVFIDDVDRLFPLEVFEMIRIIKAVGDLPNVGYVLAWDPAYVCRALDSASVPHPDTYLNKIVQVRLPLPRLSPSARETLINEALEALSPEAQKSYFPRGENRLTMLYLFGLRDVLEQPRDVTRIFNTVGVIEPALRGEVEFSDIIGLATLMVKAPAVFDLLQKNPRLFVGRLPAQQSLPDSDEDILKKGKENREVAYSKCAMPEAIRQMVHYLFPLTAKAENAVALTTAIDIEGHLAAPARLMVALQLSVSASDVSLSDARRYLFHTDRRDGIAHSLTINNCLEFMEYLGDMAESIEGTAIDDLEDLCLSIARLADQEPFIECAKNRSAFSLHPELVAGRTIQLVVKSVAPDKESSIAASIVDDKTALTVAMRIMYDSYLKKDSRNNDLSLTVAPEEKDRLVQKIAQNVLSAAKDGSLLKICNLSFVLWCLPQLSADLCPQIFEALQNQDPSLDGFVLEILRYSFDSHKGQTYAIPQETAVLKAYCPLNELREHAEKRLSDTSVCYPARAAWQALVENKCLYAKDGSLHER